MTSSESERIARSFFELLRSGDFLAALELLDDDGTAWETGHSLHADESMPMRQEYPMSLLKARLALVERGIDDTPMNFVVDNVVAHGDQVALELHNRGILGDGALYAMIYCFVLRVESGRIVGLRCYYDVAYDIEQRPGLHAPDSPVRRALRQAAAGLGPPSTHSRVPAQPRRSETATRSPIEVIALSYFEMLRARNFEGAVALLDDDGTLREGGISLYPPTETKPRYPEYAPDPFSRYPEYPLTAFKEKLRFYSHSPHATPMDFVVDNIFSQDDRVFLEVRNDGILDDGEPYEMVYAFFFRIESARIVSQHEYADTEYGTLRRPGHNAPDSPVRQALLDPAG